MLLLLLLLWNAAVIIGCNHSCGGSVWSGDLKSGGSCVSCCIGWRRRWGGAAAPLGSSLGRSLGSGLLQSLEDGFDVVAGKEILAIGALEKRE